MAVNDNVLSIRNAAHNIRSVYFLPWVIGFWLLSISFIYDFGPNGGEVAYANSNVLEMREYEKKGVDFDREEYLYYEALVGADGKSSKLEYINAVSNYSTDNHRKSVYETIIFISVLVIITIILTAGLIRFPRFAEIHFDRQRGIVYTWRFGKIAACRFENLGFREDKIGLTLFLYGESKKHKSGYWPALYGLQPTGKAHMNSEDDNTFLMAQLFAFMDQGKQAVITGEQFQRAQPKTYLFQDNKPKNFEKRLEAILEREHQLPEIYAEQTF
ncbi:hypothetical protein [Vibrio sp. SCSIO 43169]|uniref:hypothetical protein n=1 Tax=Vibrio sp. SCSIO 43169 TaxID=2822801 RepID=UPI002043F94C|nr:hypothetical protein [Vibrio sp. SCSIO 43169]